MSCCNYKNVFLVYFACDTAFSSGFFSKCKCSLLLAVMQTLSVASWQINLQSFIFLSSFTESLTLGLAWPENHCNCIHISAQGKTPNVLFIYLFIYLFIFISWRLITPQYCSGSCHTLTWISHGFTCIPHPDPPSHLPLHPIPLGLPREPGPSTCLMHPTWAGDLFLYR